MKLGFMERELHGLTLAGGLSKGCNVSGMFILLSWLISLLSLLKPPCVLDCQVHDPMDEVMFLTKGNYLSGCRPSSTKAKTTST